MVEEYPPKVPIPAAMEKSHNPLPVSTGADKRSE